ncbi:hypothetical protein NLI96_g132 [Meripilus lineatus]|uniref:Uncharacterized protein n=1 Tax=Meripilus lineatus TaxID=2056292 RepID=A0AAD5YIQ8_9APHY|nr:hypothetical protein NLI96_g132 [Physisporinus lineatus]
MIPEPGGPSSRLPTSIIYNSPGTVISQERLKHIKVSTFFKEHLDPKISFAAQPECIARVENECLRLFPEFVQYENHWPIILLARHYLYDSVRNRNRNSKGTLQGIGQRISRRLAHDGDPAGLRLDASDFDELGQVLDSPLPAKVIFPRLITRALAHMCIQDAEVPASMTFVEEDRSEWAQIIASYNEPRTEHPDHPKLDVFPQQFDTEDDYFWDIQAEGSRSAQFPITEDSPVP